MTVLRGILPVSPGAVIAALVSALLVAACERSGAPAPVVNAERPPAPASRVVTPLPGDPSLSPRPAPPPASGEAAPPPATPGAGAGPARPPADGLVRVALLLPLTGANADLGRALLDAATLAVFEIAGGKFALLPFDSRGTEAGARHAAEQAIAGGARLIVGPVFSGAAAETGAVARAAGVNVIAFSNNREVAGQGVFLLGLLPDTQVSRVVDFAGRRGLRRFAALVPDGPFGARLLEAYRLAIVATGGQLVQTEVFTEAPDDIGRAVRRIGNYDSRRAALVAQKEALAGRDDEVSKRTLERLNRLETFGPVDFDALLVGASGERLTAVAAQLGNYDIDTKRVRLLGLSSWRDPETGREPALQGAWFAALPEAAGGAFRRKYQAMFEREPHPLTPVVYDAVALAAILAEGADGPRFDVETLTSATGFAGISGLFRLSRTGLAEQGLEIRQVGERGSTLLEKAPTSFETPTN